MKSRSAWSLAAAACAAFGTLSLPGAAAGADKSAALKLYEKGKALYEAGDLRGAAARFHEAYAADPEGAYLYSEATCYRKLGLSESARAAELYERYLDAAPASETADRAKATAYAAELRLAVGVDLKARGDCKGAVAELLRAAEHAPARGEPWVHIGLCRETLGDPAGAHAAFAKALGAPDLDSALRVAAEARVAALAGPAPPAASPALVAPAESRPARRPRGTAVWGIVAGGAGALLLGGVLAGVLISTGRDGGLDFGAVDRGPVTIGGW
ncbi:MAG TPA: hypothetical protein VG389_12055 [Myxococcota bacterium]|jgi:Flp pilus assembly protein TadD|nr:hypothetical protein [Myxococcota bacterium]